jgi:hypothetical protein
MVEKPDKPDRRTIQVEITLHHEMKMDAARRDISMGDLVRLGHQALKDAEARGRKPSPSSRKRAALSA